MQRQVTDGQNGDIRKYDVFINDPSLVYKC